jgi:hypothetical protein
MPRHYPTPATTTYYINQYIIDDMFRVDFNRRQQHQPIWGYDSTRYDFIAKGKEIVTGNIIINFRYPGYLRNVMNEHAIAEAANSKRIDDKKLTKSQVNRRVRKSQEEQDDILQAFDKVANVSDKNRVIANVMGRAVEVSPSENPGINESIREMKEALENRFFLSTHGTEEESGLTEGRLRSPMDESSIIEFDLSVRYGFQGVPGGFQRIFKDVVLLGEQETVSASVNMQGDMSSSAQPILEIYPFVCRTIETKKYI